MRRGWTLACVESGGVWMDGGLGWRALLLLDRREDAGGGE